MRASVLTLILTAGLVHAGEGYEEKQCMNEEGGVCASCEFGEQETATLFAKYLAGELPEGAQCNDYCAEAVAEAAEHPGMYYARFFAGKPEGFEQLRGLVEERYQASKSDRVRLLDLVSAHGGKMVELVPTLWAADDKCFDVNHLLAFVEQGPEAIEQRLRSYAGRGGEDAASVAPAAYFAMRGDAVGKKTLRRAVKSVKAGVQESIASPMLAAIALDKLGDQKALGFVRERVHEAVLTALDAGELERARALAVQAKFFHDMARYPELSELAWLEDVLLQRAKKAARSEKLATAEAVFELIERVTPVS